MFIRLLINIVITLSHTKCVSLSNQECKTQPTLINWHPDEYIQGLYYYLVAVSLDRCAGRCNTLNDLGNKVCVPNKTENLNLSVFNMFIGINESKILTKHISCKCKCQFDGIKCNSNENWNNDKCWCKCKNKKNIM